MQGSKTTYKVDLHSHSIISHDGGIKAVEYEQALESGKLDCIAVTDHNETSFARIMHQKHGDKIIVGEEITTTDGELIGLYLKDTIAPGFSALETAKRIHAQDALVYVPHPFETFRKGIQKEVLEKMTEEIDIVEVWNGRGVLRGKPKEAALFASHYELAVAASGDAHARQGLGYTYSEVEDFPTRTSLKRLLTRPLLAKRYAPPYTLLYPFFNRIKNKIILTHD